MKTRERLGIDIGGPIIAAHNDRADTSFFSENYLLSEPTAGAIRHIERLIRERFGPENTFVVSKCGPKTEAKSREWFAYNHIYEQTGLLPEHLHFCRTREGKAPICEVLGITHFIDDRLDVHRYLTTVRHRILFQGHANEMVKYADLLPQVHHVQGWDEIGALLLK